MLVPWTRVLMISVGLVPLLLVGTRSAVQAGVGQEIRKAIWQRITAKKKGHSLDSSGDAVHKAGGMTRRSFIKISVAGAAAVTVPGWQSIKVPAAHAAEPMNIREPSKLPTVRANGIIVDVGAHKDAAVFEYPRVAKPMEGSQYLRVGGSGPLDAKTAENLVSTIVSRHQEGHGGHPLSISHVPSKAAAKLVQEHRGLAIKMTPTSGYSKYLRGHALNLPYFGQKMTAETGDNGTVTLVMEASGAKVRAGTVHYQLRPDVTTTTEVRSVATNIPGGGPKDQILKFGVRPCD